MAKKGFLDGYKMYDPMATGYGSPADWHAAFNATMGLDEAQTVLGGSAPEAVLGVAVGAVWAAVVKAFRLKSLAVHPDRCAIHGLTPDVAHERMKQVIAAFTVLKNQYGRK